MLRALLYANFYSDTVSEEILTISQNNWEPEYTAESLTISIISNTNWNITNLPDWLTVTQTSGTGNQDVTITATKNGDAERSCTFKISSNTITLEITVVQDAAVSTETTTDPGSPEITTDKETGEVTKVEYTEPLTPDGDSTIIDVTPLSGDFRITLTGDFPAQTSGSRFNEYHLLTVTSSDSKNEGFRITYCFDYWYFYCNSNTRTALASTKTGLSSIIITYQDGNLTVSANGTSVYNKAVTFTATDPQIYIAGSAYGNKKTTFPNAVTINEFTYERL